MKKILILYHGLTISDKQVEEFVNTANYVEETIDGSGEFCMELAMPHEVEEKYSQLIKQTFASKIYIYEGADFQDTGRTQQLETIYKVCKDANPDYIFCYASVWGRAVSAWLSTKLDAGVTADILSLAYCSDTNRFTYIRATSSNELLSEISCRSKPEIATIKTVGEHFSRSQKEQDICQVSFVEMDKKVRLLNRTLNTSSINSNVVIGVGRGINQAMFDKINAFAKEKNITVMGSKPVVEQGLLTHDYQVGQSGSSIAADLYIAIGISGATQHVIGIANCKKVIAINKDAHAPIHKYADVSIVCTAEDLFAQFT